MFQFLKMTFVHKFLRYLSLAGVLAATFAVAPDADARKQRLRLTTLAPKDSSFHKSLLRMSSEWKKATNGQVDLIIFAGGVQGGETAMIDRMRVNQTQASLITGVGLAEIDEAVAGLQQIPMMFRDYDELEHVMDEMAPVLNDRIAEKGFVVVSWIDTGWVRIFSKDPLRTPEDMAKGKLFTWSGDTKQTDLLKNMGFRPVPIDSTEISSSLQTGLIDIVPMPPFYALALQSYKPAPHMLDIHYTPLVGALVFSKRSWDRIAPEHQTVMREIAQKISREMTESGRQESESAIDVMRDQWGLEVQEADDEILAAWQETAKEAYSLIRDNTVPAEVFDEVVRLLEENRSSQQ